MKKFITIILLLFTFITNSQTTQKSSREEVITAPMLTCSNEERTKWFAISPTFNKFDGIIVKFYLSVIKLNIGQCSKQDALVFTFEGGRKIKIMANNDLNCDGIIQVNFVMNSIDMALLETKPLETIRYINGNDFVSFVYLLKGDDKYYFLNTFSNYKK